MRQQKELKLGVRLGTSIARTPADSKSAAAAPQKAQAVQCSHENVNSQKGTVPEASPEPRKGKKAKARGVIEEDEFYKGFVQGAAEDDAFEPKKYIEHMAMVRYANSAAIDAAIAMAYANKGKALTGAPLAAKQRVTYTDELWEEILIRVAEGESVVTICEDDHMPVRTAVYKWMWKDPELAKQYENSVLLKADKCVEQAKDMALHMKQRAEMGASTEEINALKSAIATLQWTAARLNPKKYGDKQAIDLNAKVRMPESQVDARLQFLINKAAKKQADTDEEAEA